MMIKKQRLSSWAWVPSLYFMEGLPYVMVMSVSVVLYQRLGMSNADITYYTGWLYLPWVIKPFWSPFVDLLKTKRMWIVSMQLLIGAALAGVAFTIPASFYIRASLAFFWLTAFASATHDIAADGFYMLALDEHDQSFFVGIRSSFFKLSVMFGQGTLIYIAGMLEESARLSNLFGTKHIPYVWCLIFFFTAGLCIAFFLYHRFILPKPASDRPQKNITAKQLAVGFLQTGISFFRKKGIVPAVLFLFLFRFAEAQITKLIPLFLLDKRINGGLELTTKEEGLTYGTIGAVCLALGGISGGIAIAKKGLKYWIWPMVLSLNLQNLVYIYLSQFQPQNLFLINVAVGIEQFGYGFGFTAYTMFMIYFSIGENKTTHYAICTAFMALGMMLPGMMAGKIQERIGYPDFFVWIMICTIPCFIITAFLKIDSGFGEKTENKRNAEMR
jgi:PAT family beta-lactamase induction signal transducer AmpG